MESPARLAHARLTERVRQATVALRTPRGAGTGFFVAPRVVATCAHVLAKSVDTLPTVVDARSAHTTRSFALSCRREDFYLDEAGLDLAFLHLDEQDNDAPAEWVLLHEALREDHQLWTFGHPDNMFRTGRTTRLDYHGPSRLSETGVLDLQRVGGSIAAGQSGSPVLNLSTGGVCGMLTRSNLTDSAHFLPAQEILRRCPAAHEAMAVAGITRMPWLDELSDEQIAAGDWPYPGPTLRAYLEVAVEAARSHPYPGGVFNADPPPLAEVFVEPLVEAGRGGRERGNRDKPVTAGAIFDSKRNSLLVGDAGAGKSSLFRVTVQTLVERFGRGADNRVPVRVSAADLAGDTRLPEAIAAAVNADLGGAGWDRALAADFFRAPPVPEGRWLVLVDSLDEVISREARLAVLRKLATADPGMYQFAVATRPLAEQLPRVGSAGGFDYYRLLPFSEKEVAALAGVWLARLGAKGHPAVERFTGQLEQTGLSELARSPLMATMLCQLFAADSKAALPNGRTEIYQRFVELLSHRQFSPTTGGLRQQLRARLGPYGGDADTAADSLVIRADELVGRLAWAQLQASAPPELALLEQWAGPRPTNVPTEVWRSVLADVLRRSGKLSERRGRFHFLHQTIQEFLAARYVVADRERMERELGHLFNARSWRSDSLTVGHQSYGRFLVALCPDESAVNLALSRIARRGGLNGGRFIAALATDGIELDPTVRRQATAGLSRLAGRRGVAVAHQRAGVTALFQLDHRQATQLLIRQALKRRGSADHKRWAMGILADEHLIPETASAATRPGQLVMNRLAQRGDPRMAQLLVNASKSRAFSGTERRWAAEALLQVGDPRAARLLHAIAGDVTVEAQERDWALRAIPVEVVPEPQSRLGVFRAVPRRGSKFNPARPADIVGPLVDAHRAANRRADIRLLRGGYDVAARRHAGQYRKSGDEYITHPLAVASILADLGMDTTTLVAALLHATVDETVYPLDRLEIQFGRDTALVVEGVRKLREVRLDADASDGKSLRAMISATRDPRSLMVVLADRLHDLRTLDALPIATRERCARESLELLAPLAHRLGVNAMRREIEDLSFATLFPKRFDEIQRLMGEHAPTRDNLLRQVADRVGHDLRNANIAAHVVPLPKHVYPIYQKMIARGGDFNEIFNIVRVRILVDTVRDCYAALGVIHAAWQPVPGRFKDYIAMPKMNFYQSLHTTVIGPTGKPVEMQIRTHAMHGTAEYGIAAHWKYKEGKASTMVDGTPPTHIDGMTWLRQLLDWQRETSDPGEFLDALRHDQSSQEMFVFTPKGEVIALPNGSTPVDFAYAVHTHMGHRCIGARVNSKLMPLESALSNGDVVEIFTSKSETAGPTQDWLGFVKSSRAKTKIRQYFNKERRDEAIDAGKDMLARALRHRGVPLRVVTGQGLRTVARELRLDDVTSLYAAVGDGRVAAADVVDKLVLHHDDIDAVAATPLDEMPEREPRPRGFSAPDLPTAPVRAARCCTPAPKDDVVGYIRRSGAVAVHRRDCSNAGRPDPPVKVVWQAAKGSIFLTAIQVEALRTPDVISRITAAIRTAKVEINSADLRTTRDGIVVARMTLELADVEHLSHLLNAVRDVEGVMDCYRVSGVS